MYTQPNTLTICCLPAPANANEYLCEHGGLEFVVKMMKTGRIADGVRQAALYCISAVIEENGTNHLSLVEHFG